MNSEILDKVDGHVTDMEELVRALECTPWGLDGHIESYCVKCRLQKIISQLYSLTRIS